MCETIDETKNRLIAMMRDWDESHVLSRTEAIAILRFDAEQLKMLLSAAGALRKKYKGRKVSVQILTNVRSGNCSQNCAYCAQSGKAHTGIDTYRWVDDDTLYGDNDLVDDLQLSRHCIGLSGIRFTDAEIEELARRVRTMKKNDTQICCSIGFLTEQQAHVLLEAGVNRINHNLNTSRRFYPQICTTHTYDERRENIRMLQRVGFEICCGGIIGMGESDEDVADMLLDVREIRPQSVPVNFLLPIPGTRLGERSMSDLSTDYCLKILCLARLLLPQSDIRCAAGREVYFKDDADRLFTVVDSIFASGYLTEGGQGVDETLRLIREAGYEGTIESA